MDLNKKLKDIPNTCGVYIMTDKSTNVLYVGKSKHLKSRVRSYFNTTHVREKLNRLVYFVDDIKIIETETHLDALILEIDLIKKYRPQYNSQFKKNNKIVYVEANRYSSGKLINLTQKHHLFSIGPFRNRGAILKIEDYLLKCAPVKSIDDLNDFHIIPKRLSLKEYQETQSFFLDLLKDSKKIEAVSKYFEMLMIEAGNALEFEKANMYKQLIYALGHVTKSLHTLTFILYIKKLEEGTIIYAINNLIITDRFEVEEVNEEVIREIINKSSNKEIELDQQLKLDYQMVIYRELNENQDDIIYVDEFK